MRPSPTSLIVLKKKTEIYGAQRSIYKKEEKDSPRAGSKLDDYLLQSGPLHNYFLQSVNRSRLHYDNTSINS